MQEMERIRKYSRQAIARQKWLRIWEKIEKRVSNLPEQTQQDLLEDIAEAVENRVAVMERAQRE